MVEAEVAVCCIAESVALLLMRVVDDVLAAAPPASSRVVWKRRRRPSLEEALGECGAEVSGGSGGEEVGDDFAGKEVGGGDVSFKTIEGSSLYEVDVLRSAAPLSLPRVRVVLRVDMEAEEGTWIGGTWIGVEETWIGDVKDLIGQVEVLRESPAEKNTAPRRLEESEERSALRRSLEPVTELFGSDPFLEEALERMNGSDER